MYRHILYICIYISYHIMIWSSCFRDTVKHTVGIWVWTNTVKLAGKSLSNISIVRVTAKVYILAATSHKFQLPCSKVKAAEHPTCTCHNHNHPTPVAPTWKALLCFNCRCCSWCAAGHKQQIWCGTLYTWALQKRRSVWSSEGLEIKPQA